MELEAALRNIHNLRDISSLLGAMGHHPLYEPAALLSDRAPGGPDGEVIAVGRTGTFPWFALTSLTPEAAARSLARRLGQRGRIAGVLALDEQRRRLALAVDRDGTPSLVIDLSHPSSGALASLGKMCGGGDGGALAYAARVADALSIESVGRRFFREFRAVLERMAAAIAGPIRGQ